MRENQSSARGRTFEDDCVRVEGRCYSCQQLGLEWPPPETLHFYVESPGIAVVSPLEHPAAVAYRRVSYSQITDEERAQMTHVFRGADYEAVES